MGTGSSSHPVLLAVTLAAVLGTAVGCGSGAEPDEGGAAAVRSVNEAISQHADDDGVVRVRGYVLAAPTGVVRLCTGLAGSFPPQCGNPYVEVEGFDVETLPDRDTASGVAWSGEMVVSGTFDGVVLRVHS